MRVLVYPHDLNMGGSQLNAIELAAAVRSLGHECVVFGQAGVLGGRLAELGLEFIDSPRPSHRPTPAIVSALGAVVKDRGIDIVHGYEWPPGLEGYLAATGHPTARAVCTVMSMSVAPFLPRELPLVVGTRQIAAHERAAGRHRVHVLEPPVDLDHNLPPDAEVLATFRERWGLDGRPLVVCVGRLATELKAEGLLTAIEVAGELADTDAFQLLLVGDGPARAAIEAAAVRVNQRTASNTVVLTGELLDPRPAYAVADVALAMGGSALRSMAFGKPLVVQGEVGFFRTLTPESVETFRWQGWYGVGRGAAEGASALRSALEPLLGDRDLRRSLGGFARQVVEDYSLQAAARRQVEIYEAAVASAPSRGPARSWDAVVSGAKLAVHIGHEQVNRLARRQRSDDFNARPVVAEETLTSSEQMTSLGDGPIVYLPGVTWDAIRGTDHHLAISLARHREVIWVDPPASIIRVGRRDLFAGSSSPAPGITRLRTVAPPGVSRPLIRDFASLSMARGLNRHLARTGTRPSAIIASSSGPALAAVRAVPGIKVYLATDDFVEAAQLWGIPASFLAKARERNLAVADLVLAVTPALAAHLQRHAQPPVWFPNGADLDRYRGIEDVRPADGIGLDAPLAGVVGQFNERTELSLLRAVAEAGIGLLLVGPESFATDRARAEFAELITLPEVQWVGRVPAESLPGYLIAISVGLTAYADSAFNRRSYPLKTVEYLAAGIPVVSTRVAPLAGLDERFVRGATGAEEFVTAVRSILDQRPSRAEIQSAMAGQGWDDRADLLLALLASHG